ncbi:MAG: hypothetical protein AAGB34_10855, partial [Planctomycetota bacterium]
FRGDLSLIAAKALDRDIELRYDSAAAFGDDLRRALRDEPITAKQHARWYRVQKFAKRHRVAVGASVTGLVLLLSTAIIAVWFAFSAVAAQRVAEETAARADRAAYQAAISAASAAIREGDARLAREFLDNAPPALRGWEWWHFQGELDASVDHIARSHPWTGEAEHFLFGSCWLSKDEKTLHTAVHYLDSEHHFESFEMGTLRSLGHWKTNKDQWCVGTDPNTGSVIFFEITSGDFVVRDLVSGQESWRWDGDPEIGLPWRSYDPLPANTEAFLRSVAYQQDVDKPWFYQSALDPGLSRWAVSVGRFPTVLSIREEHEPVELGVLREAVSKSKFSPDGKSIAVTTLDRRIDLYDAATGQKLWGHTEAHSDAPMSVAFSPDGVILATGGQDRVIKLWNAKTGEPIGRLIGHDSTVIALVFSADGETLYSADGGAIRIWRIQDAIEPNTVAHHSTFARAIALNESGTALASRVPWKNTIGATTTEVMVYEPGSGLLAHQLVLPPELERVRDFAFISPTQLAVLALDVVSEDPITFDIVLCIFEVPSGRLQQTLEFGQTRSYALDAGPDGIIIAGTPTIEIERESMAIHILESRKHLGPWLRTRPELEWVGIDGEVIYRFEPLKSTVMSWLADPDRPRVYVGTQDGALRIFDLETGEPIAKLESSAGSPKALALHPDGTRLFGGFADTTIRVWDTSTLELVAILRGHRDTVNDLIFSPDGSTLYSASDDYTVRSWKVASEIKTESRQ